MQLKNDAAEVLKFKLADFAEPDQKYLRDLAVYRRKVAAGEKPELPKDPAQASLEIQPRQTITEPAPDLPPSRKPLLDFPVRIWTDTTGKKVQGKLATAYNDKVVIDVKGNIFDLPVTRLSPEDQQYVAIQLKGLQRDDLVNVLAKAAATDQPSPNGTPNPTAAPTTVAASASPPTGTDDIRARLEQLKSQLHGNPDTGTPAAAATTPEQPSASEDIQTRLAKIREMKKQAAPETPSATPAASIPVTEPTPLAYNPPPVPVFEPPQIPSGPMFRMGKQCMTCKKEVPGNLTAGDKCPHCGVFFGKDMTTGKTAQDPWSPKTIGSLITLGIAVLAGLGKLISKMTG